MTSEFEQELDTETIRQKILHILDVYPKLSHSMLQIGLGTNVSAKFWRPVLDQLINEKKVHVDSEFRETPQGRMLTYTVITLANSKTPELTYDARAR